MRQSLAEAYPDLAKKWHPSKNGELTPEMVSAGSGKKVWWCLPYDDPETGKHFDFEWQANISNMTKYNCPFISGLRVWSGFNDLASRYPELVKEWHPVKNGDLKPSEVLAGGKTKYWWYLPYDDPETGKHFDFEWQESVYNRGKRGYGCPILSGNMLWVGFNDLASRHPDIAAQWHPVKNGDLKPSEVMCTSNKKIWWHKFLFDPKTGKMDEFEWETTVYRMVRKTRRVTGENILKKKVMPGINDLASRHPDIAAQWHPVKNGNVKPSEVLAGGNKKYWWYLSYDDVETGKHFDFEWQDSIYGRVKRGHDCPILTGRVVWPGYNDLASKYPEVAVEWHPVKNGKLKPTEIAPKSNKKVWWYLPYDDPETGKHFDFEWQERVSNRTIHGCSCPYLSGNKVWSGYNDLASRHPEIVAEWHPEKNGKLKPENIYYGSLNMVWWYLPYDDPETGKHFDFEWKSTVRSRTYNKAGCPFLTWWKVWPGFNDLASRYPEIVAEWHPVRNGELKPTEMAVASNRKVWWYLPYDDPKTGKHYDFEWQESICNRTINGCKCPYFSGKKVWPGYNDFASRYPEKAKMWHPKKNGKLKPSEVTASSFKKIWWYLPYDDPETGKHFEFEWKERVYIWAAEKMRCPYLSNYRAWPGYNDLASIYPEIAAEWHPDKNGKRKPDEIYYGSQEKVWWYLPYDDPKTGKHFDFEWKSSVHSRTRLNLGCPYLSGQKVWSGYNDLASCCPEIAEEWHPTKNRKKIATNVYVASKKKYWWKCPVCDHEWRTSVGRRTRQGTKCPNYSKHIVREE